jgi:hypothetical protein
MNISFWSLEIKNSSKRWIFTEKNGILIVDKRRIGILYIPRGSSTTLYKKLRETASFGVVCFCLSSYFKLLFTAFPLASECKIHGGERHYRVLKNLFFFFSGRERSL